LRPAHLRGLSEVANDIYRHLTNFYRVVRDEETFPRFKRQVDFTQFNQVEWEDSLARMDDPDPVMRAWAFFVRNRQSLAGRMDTSAPLSKNRTRGNRNEQVNAWWSAVEGLPAVLARLRDVAVLNQPALEVIRKHDAPTTLFYLDPPYLHETRTAREVYDRFEMTDHDHQELLERILSCEGKVMLSGYRSELYDDMLAAWRREEKEINNHAAGGATKRRMTECLWMNFRPDGQALSGVSHDRTGA
jgi:DNA adenine methylase